MPRSLWTSLVGLALASAAAAPAFANPRPFGFTYQYATTPGATMELEQYVDLIPIDLTLASGEEATRLRYDLQTEFEYGLSSHWELGFYLVSRQPADGTFFFRGIKQRLRGRFAEEGELPLDIGVYLEVAEFGDKIELEEKLILGKRIGPVLIAVNISFEQEIAYDGGEVEVVFNPSAGLSWAATPNVHLGLEYRADGELKEFGEADHYLGPVLMLMKGEYFATLGGYAHVGGESDGDVWFRILLGIGL